MAEDKNQFQSIYGDAEDEFEIEDVSDETLSIPTEEIRAAREAGLEEEAEEAEAAAKETAQEVTQEEASAPQPAPIRAASAQAARATSGNHPATRRDHPTTLGDDPAAPGDDLTIPVEKSAPHSEEELEGITFDDEEAPATQLRHTPVRDHLPERDHIEHHDENGYRDRYYDDYDRDDRYADSRDLDEEPEAERVSILSYIGHAVLFTIPVIGTILMLVYIISDKRNLHLRHFAQIWLVTLLVIAIGASVAVSMLGLA